MLARAPHARRAVKEPTRTPAETFEDSSPLFALIASTVASMARVLQDGDRLGPYEIVSPLGAGGMSEVYRGRDTRLDRTVAIKVVSSALAGAPDLRERFDREARAISSLSHPHICPLFDVGNQDGVDFLVMEYLEGETLASRLQRGALPLSEALALAIQIASALDAAHRAGVVHRDVKPGNVMITSAGAKLVDFGLAKARTSSVVDAGDVSVPTAPQGLTGPSTLLGTCPYMSPEQLRGLPVDERTDLFSFGIVLYEMVSGVRPFPGSSASAVVDAILSAPPRDFGENLVPGRLKSLIWRLLETDPANRFGSAEEVHRELQALNAVLPPTRSGRRSRPAWFAAGAAAVLVAAMGGWLWNRASGQRWALETAMPEVTRLLAAGEFVQAAALTRRARAVLPNDPTLERLWTRATGEASISSEPSDADVSIRPYRGDSGVWETLGQTPLKKLRVPMDTYVWRLVKPGFAPTFFIGQIFDAGPPGFHSDLEQRLSLRRADAVPPEMVVVSGGGVSLTYPFRDAPHVAIDDFLIDRHEVTNEEYKAFVDSGGYLKREYWKQPFVRDGHALPWKAAVALFHDKTGRPGPAGWTAGNYPKGLENHPVAGVSWYEAAAYAEFAGKSLPTAYHWTLASQAIDYTPIVTAGSNFQNDGTRPVGQTGALSGFGTTDMAGNVKEWCLNEGQDGKRFILGGGFGEPMYMFNFSNTQSPWDRRPNFGFRCVKLNAPPAAGTAARIEVTTHDYSKDTPVSDEVFGAFLGLYAYDKGELHARVEETETSTVWSREKVTFDAAYGFERVTAHLFLPKGVAAPLQAVVYFPGGFAVLDDELDLSLLENTLDFVMKSGRALLVPIYKGTYARRDGLRPGGKPPAFFRDHVIAWSKDLGRSLDYLETRKEFDATKVAYFGASLGAVEGALLLAVEKRVKVAILSSGGFQRSRALPEVDPFNFATRVTVPVLMLSGRYDGVFPLESSQLPFFRRLGTPAHDKKHVVYEDGHGAFPHPAAIRESLDWLDKYLGSVRR